MSECQDNFIKMLANLPGKPPLIEGSFHIGHFENMRSNAKITGRYPKLMNESDKDILRAYICKIHKPEYDWE